MDHQMHQLIERNKEQDRLYLLGEAQEVWKMLQIYAPSWPSDIMEMVAWYFVSDGGCVEDVLGIPRSDEYAWNHPCQDDRPSARIEEIME